MALNYPCMNGTDGQIFLCGLNPRPVSNYCETEHDIFYVCTLLVCASSSTISIVTNIFEAVVCCAAEFAEHVQLDVEIRLSLHELSVECMQGVNILSRSSLTRPWNCLLERVDSISKGVIQA